MTEIWTGTADATNGDATITVDAGDPLSDANCSPGSLVLIDGVAYFVLSRTSTLAFELTRVYAGSTDTGVSMEISPVSEATTKLVNLATIVARTQAQINVLDKNSQGLFYGLLGVTGAADPGPGKVAFNDPTPTDITEVYIDDVDANGRPVDGLIDLWTAGTIVLIRSLASTAYISLRLPGGVSVESGYRSAEVQYVDHDGVLADGEDLSIGWFRVGEGLEIDAVGSFSGRVTYNAAAAGFVYLSTNGNGSSDLTPSLYYKNSATSGDWSAQVPFQGAQGDKGWAPRLAVASDGGRRVLQLAGYIGGAGTAPTTGVGQYLASGGLDPDIADGVDVRGAEGLTAYQVAVAVGFVGDEEAWLASLAGLSAYQVAVDDGFVGDVAAWLASLNGLDGADGADGTDPGVLMIWSDVTTDADPGAGVVRADNIEITSAATLFVSKTNRAGDSIAGFLAGLATSSNPTKKGTITLTRSGGNAQAIFDVTGITDATGYVKVAVANGSGAAEFDLNDLVSIQFYRAGDRGASGAGTGDFNGPASAVGDNLVAFDSTTGKLGKDSGIGLSNVLLKGDNLASLTAKNTALDNLHINGADIASAATVNLETATGAFVRVTGTAATTEITLSDGHQRLVRAAAAWPLTHGTNLQLPGGANYTCAAGDMIHFVADGAVIRATIFPVSGLPVFQATESDGVLNLGLAASVAASALTIAVKQADGSNDANASAPVVVGMRPSTVSGGGWNKRRITGGLSLVVPSGATLGQASATIATLYVYLQDNSGTLELVVSGIDLGESGILTSTTISTSADLTAGIYAATGRSNVPFRKIAELVNTQTTAGTWAANPSTIRLAPFPVGTNVRVTKELVAIGENAAAAMSPNQPYSEVRSMILIGDRAGQNTIGGRTNIGIGIAALQDAQWAFEAIGIGSGALKSLNRDPLVDDSRTASRNTGIGSNAGRFLRKGYQNNFLGRNAGHNVYDGTDNTFIGYNAGTGGFAPVGLDGEIYHLDNVDAVYSTGLGSNALSYNAASYQVAVGALALNNVKNGTRNVAIGMGALENLDKNLSYSNKLYDFTGGAATYTQSGATVTISKTAVNAVAGNKCRLQFTTGTLSTLSGDNQYFVVATAPNANTFTITVPAAASGSASGNCTIDFVETNTTGTISEKNVVIGYAAGNSLLSGTRNVLIGQQAGENVGSTAFSDWLAIQNSDTRVPLISGKFDVPVMGFNVAPSDIKGAGLHIRTGVSGVGAVAGNGDDLIIESSSQGGLSIFTPNNVTGNIYFGDPEDADAGRLVYNHSGDAMTIVTAGSTRVTVTTGVQIGSPTGGDKGAGTLNATAVYDDNTLLTCYPIEAATKGAIDLSFWDSVAADATGHSAARRFAEERMDLLDLDTFIAAWREKGHLPTLPSRDQWKSHADDKMPLGIIVQMLWETVDVMAVHMAQIRDTQKD